jgi:hypothetical protein
MSDSSHAAAAFSRTRFRTRLLFLFTGFSTGHFFPVFVEVEALTFLEGFRVRAAFFGFDPILAFSNGG